MALVLTDTEIYKKVRQLPTGKRFNSSNGVCTMAHWQVIFTVLFAFLLDSFSGPFVSTNNFCVFTFRWIFI